jgi:hypothetical protein
LRGFAWQIFYSHLPLLGIVILMIVWSKRGSRAGLTKLTQVVLYGLMPLGVVLVAFYRSAQLFEWIDKLPLHLRPVLPRAVYLVSAVNFLLVLLPRAHSPFGRSLTFLLAPLPSLLMLLGPRSSPAILFLLMQLFLLVELERDLDIRFSSFNGVLLVLLAYYYYYVTGHDIAISSLQMEAGYYGLEVRSEKRKKESVFFF